MRDIIWNLGVYVTHSQDRKRHSCRLRRHECVKYTSRPCCINYYVKKDISIFLIIPTAKYKMAFKDFIFYVD